MGYVQPGHDTFPPVDKLHDLILACGALPCAAWLDGTTSGEERMDDLFDLLVGKAAQSHSTSCPTATGTSPTRRAR